MPKFVGKTNLRLMVISCVVSNRLFQVTQDCNNPDYSRPPPGYLPSGERLHGTVNLTSTSTSANSEININVSKNPRDLNSDPCMTSVSSGSKQHQTFQVLVSHIT